MSEDRQSPRASFDRFAHLKALRRPTRPQEATTSNDVDTRENAARDAEHRTELLHAAPRELTVEPCISTAAELLASLLDAAPARTDYGEHLALRALRGGCPPCEPTPRALQLLEPRASAEALDISRWLFLDTETTGLAGGTGTYAFLIGLAWYEDGLLRIEQHFMRDYDEERSMLSAIARLIDERPVIVTYNGKSFDWPLLDTRFRLTRAIDTPRLTAHLDFLHPARALWQAKFGGAKLSQLEQHILGWERDDDIPSADIPQLYLDFVRLGAAAPLVPVFLHNQMDLAGLAALAQRVLTLLDGASPSSFHFSDAPRANVPNADVHASASRDCETAISAPCLASQARERREPSRSNTPPSPAPDASELFALSRLCERRGQRARARQSYEQSLAVGASTLSAEESRAARLALARLAKRDRDFARACELWQSLLGNSPEGYEAYEQLAMHYEHESRELSAALETTQQALAELRCAQQARLIVAARFSQLREAFEHRRLRLERKLAAKHPELEKRQLWATS